MVGGSAGRFASRVRARSSVVRLGRRFPLRFRPIRDKKSGDGPGVVRRNNRLWLGRWLGRVLSEAVAQTLNRLSARGVTTIKQPGLHADGGGLYLRVDAKGAKRWVFVFRRGAKRTEMGLGSVTAVDLVDARGLAKKARAWVGKGLDPIAELKRERTADRVPKTFGEIADAQLEIINADSRGEKNRARWERSLKVHATALRDKPVSAITTQDVLAVVKPWWPREAGARLRSAIERVMDAAKVMGEREGENPARWKGHLDHLLPQTKKLTRGHHAAMPYADLPAFYARLAAVDAPSAVLLRFQILTAVRPTEAREARWEEIDGDVWAIPSSRMKEGRAHRVPLSSVAVALLDEIAPDERSGLVIRSRRGGALSYNAARKKLQQMGATITAHGFRSAFSDWAAETTDFPHELIELCLAHKIGTAVSRAYRRGDALDKRREVMEAWGRFVAG
jgi:integrase